MTKYYVLVRKISPYSGADVLLGVFLQQSAAEAARESYQARYRQSPSADPWFQQGYKPEGLVVQDLHIETLNLESPITDNEVSIVSLYFEGMGQVIRQLDSIHSSTRHAEERVAEVEATMAAADLTTDDVPSCCITQTLVLGELQSDSPEDQPLT